MKKFLMSQKFFNNGKIIEEIILGGQDGLVNVLGIVLGIAAATSDSRIVVIAGLAATFAESIAMAAVAFTSQKAAKQYYESEKQREIREMHEMPESERQEIREIFAKKGFKGKELERVVQVITSDKQIWLDVMMKEELNLGSYEEKNPKKAAFIVGVSAFIGSMIPLAPFFFTTTFNGIILSITLSIATLFAAGALKSHFTIGNWKKNGLEMAAIGTLAAITGYAIGLLLQGI